MGSRRNTMFNPQASSFAMPASNPPLSYRNVPPPAQLYNVPPVNQAQVQWSTIECSPAHIEKLALLCHSQKELKKEGYILEPLSDAQIQTKLRCIKCNKRVPSKSPSQVRPVLSEVIKQRKEQRDPTKPFCDEAAGGCGISGHTVDNCYRLHPELKLKAMNDREERKKNRRNVGANDINLIVVEALAGGSPAITNTTPSVEKKKRSGACQYHTGEVEYKYWTCCQRHASKEGCTEDDEHDLPPPNNRTLLDYWRYHTTPDPLPAANATATAVVSPPTDSRGKRKNKKKYQALVLEPYARSFTPSPTRKSLHAIALDCEMGTSSTSEVELIRLTAVDFFTGKILIDNLVQPSVPMAHYNTRYSGVTPGAMRHAIRSGSAIQGRDRARMALLEFVGPETVVIVHGGSSDFSALRWIHPHIIDTFIVEGYTGKKVEGGKSLQNLCKVNLGLDVQIRDAKAGKLGHDSYEDAMATRELAIQSMRNIPDA